VENNNGQIIALVCGEAYLPPRGIISTTGDLVTIGTTVLGYQQQGCQCQPISVSDPSGSSGAVRDYFTGQACECAVIYVPDMLTSLPCAGHGTCLSASFPYGRCEYDTLDFNSDPLSSPFTNVAASSTTALTFTFGTRANSSLDGGLGDMRSVVAINGESWFVAPGQEFTISTLVNSFAICTAGPPQFPVNITYGCLNPGVSVDPQRAIANLTIQLVGGSTYSELCDPATLACAATVSCGFGLFPCVLSQVWQSLNSSEQLDVGLYQNVWFPCATATLVGTLDLPSALGVLDCSNVVDRNLDKAEWLANPAYALQCNGTVTPYSNVLGELYGLFYNGIPDLTFLPGQVSGSRSLSWGSAPRKKTNARRPAGMDLRAIRLCRPDCQLPAMVHCWRPGPRAAHGGDD